VSRVQIHILETTLQITVHKPTLAKPRQPISIATRGRPLTGQVWGFVDTSKVNADLFIEGIQTEIRQRFLPKDFIVVRKESPGVPLSGDQIHQLSEQCGFVIFCFGD
jgi:hypothetical protein